MANHSRIFPIVMHRWFSEGAGWAFHPSQDGLMLRIGQTLAPQLEIRSRSSFRVMQEDKVFLGVRYPDERCQNVLAKGRGPTVLAAAVINEALSAADEEEILQFLWQYDYPQKAGPTDLLVCKLPNRFVVIADRSFVDWMLSLAGVNIRNARLGRSRELARRVLTDVETDFSCCLGIGKYEDVTRVCSKEFLSFSDGKVLKLHQLVTANEIIRRQQFLPLDNPAWRFEFHLQSSELTLIGFRPQNEGGGEVIHMYRWSGQFVNRLRILRSISRTTREIPSQSIHYPG